MSSRRQKQAVADFREITGANDAVAIRLLQVHQYSVDRAVDAFYAEGDGHSAAVAPSTASRQTAIEQEFLRLAPSGTMNEEELETFCQELGVDLTADNVVLVIAYNMGAKTMGSFTKDEFVSGFQKMGVSSVTELKAKLPQLRSSLSGRNVFAPFWGWLYGFNCDPGQKTMALDVAIGVTEQLLTKEQWPLAEEWVTFLKGQKKSVSRDTWTVLLRFMDEAKADLSGYDEDSAWPVMLDDFVDWLRERKS